MKHFILVTIILAGICFAQPQPIESLSPVDKITFRLGIGLNNVDNTSDVAKPLSNATVSALALKASLASPALSGAVSVSGTLSLSTSDVIGSLTLTSASAYLQNYLGSGGHTFTLPPASSAFAGGLGQVLIIKNAGSGSLTILRAGADTIFYNVSVSSVTLNIGEALTFHASSLSRWTTY